MIRDIEYFCRFKEQGCEEAFKHTDLLNHEATCPKNTDIEVIEPLTQCKVCSQSLQQESETETPSLINKQHFCDNFDGNVCSKHTQLHYTTVRITNQ